VQTLLRWWCNYSCWQNRRPAKKILMSELHQWWTSAKDEREGCSSQRRWAVGLHAVQSEVEQHWLTLPRYHENFGLAYDFANSCNKEASDCRIFKSPQNLEEIVILRNNPLSLRCLV
jgi:hypothetical protein